VKTGVDLRLRNTYVFAGAGEGVKRSFTLLVGTVESVQEELKKVVGVPGSYELGQNYPNPFNPVTTIGYAVPVESDVGLRVYDLAGRMVAELVNGVQGVGRYAAVLDGRALASGTYFYRMIASARDGSGRSFTDSKRMLLIK
jgi:hypothetical protein